MRKLILFFLFVFSVTVGFAQSFSGDKLFISVDGGKGVLFGKSNLSPFGVNYRGEYNGGFRTATWIQNSNNRKNFN